MTDPADGSWETVAQLADIPRGTSKRVPFADREIALFHLTDGEVRAIADACPHAGYSLSDSPVEGHEVTCTLHSWVFDLDTGRCTFGARDVQTYPCRLENGEVQLALPARDATRQSKVKRAIGVCIATGIEKKLPDLVDKALALDVEIEELLGLGRAAATAELLPAFDALEKILTEFPSVPAPDVVLAGLHYAAQAADYSRPIDDVEPPAVGDGSRFAEDDARHLRRRLVATVEMQDAHEACEVVEAYVRADHNPSYVAQDLLRLALERHPAHLPVVLEQARAAYRWQASDRRDLHAAIARLAAGSSRD